VLAACGNAAAGERIETSPILQNGDSWSYTFDEPGTYQIRCRPHANMRQTVEVVAAGEGASASADAQMRGLQFEPRTLTVETGGTVTWTSHDRQAHDVDIWYEGE